MIDWKAKLTSRKFWMALVGLISGLLMAFRVDNATVETVSGCIMAMASVVAFVIGEGLVDAAGAANDAPLVIQGEAEQPPDGE